MPMLFFGYFYEACVLVFQNIEDLITYRRLPTPLFCTVLTTSYSCIQIFDLILHVTPHVNHPHPQRAIPAFLA